jgi:hypothetical protein
VKYRGNPQQIAPDKPSLQNSLNPKVLPYYLLYQLQVQIEKVDSTDKKLKTIWKHGT